MTHLPQGTGLVWDAKESRTLEIHTMAREIAQDSIVTKALAKFLEQVITETVAAERETSEALRKEMDKLWTMFVIQCESIEERDKPAGAGSTPHEEGFFSGEKYAAKSIRRSVLHPSYNKADFPAYHGEA